MKAFVEEQKADSLRRFLSELLKMYNIKGNINVPEMPDEEGDFYIVINAENVKSLSKALSIEKNIESKIREKFGENILVSVIPG